MPSMTHIASLRSSESSISSCSDMSVEANFYEGGYVEDIRTDSCQEDSGSLKKHQYDSNLPIKSNGIHQTFETAENNVEKASSFVDEGLGTSLSNDEVDDARFWLPPEPEDEEDDIVGSVANYDDDDDECGDVGWAEPSSLSSFGEEGKGCGSYKFKEKKLRAMNDVRNGKFMALVSQLVKSVGVDSCENWVDIVTSLSWEAAAFVKPDAQEGKTMDPDGYVKVKCIATGSRTERGYVEDIRTDSCQEDSGSLKKHQYDSNLPIKSNGIHQTFETAENNVEKASSFVDESLGTSLSNDEVDDARFWLPPEPEDEEDDIVGSVANYDDDDDECGDVGWAEPSSLSSFGEEGKGSGSYKFKEEKLRAMNNVRNGKFMALVSQLVKSVGVDSCENWVDIVTSLSWEAAAFVKPDAQEGKTMDPDGYVKVKCIATGSRTESQVFKGLVFKKHAAHKHMPTMYKNPKLLLIHGSLDLSSGGLSSFESMQQDKNNFKSIIEMIEMYHPNVILVEKSVSRDIQESILAKGMTLVFDMKLHRLERVARCIEEHTVSTEGGKKLSKTLMFLEGAPSRLGCTILLKGANSDELKRIKCVVRCAVVMAYHLMLETSFLLDQSAMFSTIPPSDSENNSTSTLDIPIFNGFHEMGSSESNLSLSVEPYNAANFPGISLSTSIQKVMDDNFPVFDGRNQDGLDEYGIQISSAPETVDQYDEKPKVRSEEPSDTQNHSDSGEEQMHSKDEISSVLDSESILVLMSSCNASRGTICEQRHFSHIKFYRSFDVPLGKFLRDNLLNQVFQTLISYLFNYRTYMKYSSVQRLQCKTCAEPPELHLFYYAHHNKQLTIQVRRLPAFKSLPGESEGKLWMWSRCGQCKIHDGSSKSTKRVLISTAARGLSFGKFLELSFSNHSSFKCPSSCGHSFHKDFLYFFGLGPMVAMFRYSPVATYSVSLPSQKIEFHSSVKGDYLKKDFENVYKKGISMFLDIEKSLMEIGTRYVGVTLNIQGSSKKFSDIVEMLMEERSQFEADIQNAINNGGEDFAVCNLLRLNRVRLELLLESCLWDRRLHALLSSDLTVIDSESTNLQAREQHLLEENGTPGEESSATDIAVEHCENELESTSESEIKIGTSVNTNEFPIIEIPIDGQVEGLSENGSAAIAINVEGFGSGLNSSLTGKNHLSVLSNMENGKGWMWVPFTDIRQKYMKDLQRGHLPIFESFGSFLAESTPRKLITEEGSRMHIPLGTKGYIVSDYEDEFSSIIACALTLLKDVALEGDASNSTRLFSLTSRNWSSFGSFDSDGIQSPPSNSLEDSHSSSFDGLDLLDSLVSYGDSHPTVSIGKRKYSVVCLYASQFRELQNRCCPSEVAYIASLSRCENWDAKGGKSKSFFAKTLDDRFIIKEIKRTEFDSFMKFAPNYFEYMNQCYELGNQTCLAKILGIYQVSLSTYVLDSLAFFHGHFTFLTQVVIRATKNTKETRNDLLVMENLSFGRNIAKQYDLKGALHARLCTAGNDPGDVLLDQNFVNDMNVSPLYVSRKSKRNLQRAVYNDTNFLNSINVMDYSLLVGVDTQRRELVCGIIDYLRQYTWDKQLENWVKSSLVVPKNQLPTIISPKEYKKRFRKFMDTHFLSVPDHWCSQRSSNPCKLCGPVQGNNVSSHTHRAGSTS
ncbi:hypothetical protein RD792_000741 [Penstemon davidsonii]|uniref:1-phosphatidylinositol-3-phosphate 5-kinase n=1 Tax=Penstemon davidsonii TaxID=160366 RepID=A0ABR0DM99_9LAMI|nr:hypothetical protein RD792_000741 [Penstemon davidsonii]